MPVVAAARPFPLLDENSFGQAAFDDLHTGRHGARVRRHGIDAQLDLERQVRLSDGHHFARQVSCLSFGLEVL